MGSKMYGKFRFLSKALLIILLSVLCASVPAFAETSNVNGTIDQNIFPNAQYLTVSAENGYAAGYGQVDITNDADTSSTTLKLTATGYTQGILFWATKYTTTTTCTITNNHPTEDILLTFSDNTAQTVTKNGGTYSFTYTSPAGNGNTGSSEKKIVGIWLASETVAVTFSGRIGGTFTVKNSAGTAITNGSNIASGGSVSVDSVPQVKYTLTASAATGYEFKGWMNSTSGVMSASATYTYTASAAATVYPMFAKSGSAMYYLQGAQGQCYEDFDTAMNAANTSTTNKTVVVAASGTMKNSTGVNTAFTIPAGVKLLVPYSNVATSVWNEVPETWGRVTHNGNAANTKPAAFRTLTVPANATVTCNGSINVNAKQFSSSNNETGTVAGVSGYGKLVMSNGSKLLLENGSALACYGYITGDGIVKAKSGSTVYELLQIMDWRGGNATTSAVSKKIFPFSQYFVQNVECDLKVYSGATTYACATLEAGDNKDIYQVAGKYVGEGGFFALGTNAVFLREYNTAAATDRITYTLQSGTMSVGSIELSMGGTDMNTADYIFAINSNITLKVAEGTTVTMTEDYKMLPNLEIIVDGTLDIDGSLYIYDYADWTSGTYTYNANYYKIPYIATINGGSSRALAEKSARLEVNGTLQVDGKLYTTSGNSCTDKVLQGTGKFIYNGTAATGTLTEGVMKANDVLGKIIWSVDAKRISCSAVLGYQVDAPTTMKSFTGGGQIYYGLRANNGNQWYQHKLTYVNGNDPENDKTVKYIVGHTDSSYSVTKYQSPQASISPNSSDEAAAISDSVVAVSDLVNGTEEYTITVYGVVAQVIGSDGTITHLNCYTLEEANNSWTAGSYIQMLDNSHRVTTLSDGVYLDLNGHKVTGVTLKGTLYGLDSATDGYDDPEGDKDLYGSIKISGGTVAPVTDFDGKNTTEGSYTVNTHRYLAVQSGSAWQFHRFNISVTDYYLEVLSTGSASIGFGATFRGDSVVKDQVTDTGFTVNNTGEWAGKSQLETVDGVDKLYYTIGTTVMGDNTAFAMLEFNDKDTQNSESRTVNFLSVLKTYYDSTSDTRVKNVIDKFRTAAQLTWPTA